MTCVQSVEQSTKDAKVKATIQAMMVYDNIPRKKKQFMNFMANSLRMHQAGLEQVWTKIYAAWLANKAQREMERKAEEEQRREQKAQAAKDKKARKESAKQEKSTSSEWRKQVRKHMRGVEGRLKIKVRFAPGGLTLEFRNYTRLWTCQ